jgi:hypothetical protein
MTGQKELSDEYYYFCYLCNKGIGSVRSAKVVTFGDADFNHVD